MVGQHADIQLGDYRGNRIVTVRPLVEGLSKQSCHACYS